MYEFCTLQELTTELGKC